MELNQVAGASAPQYQQQQVQQASPEQQPAEVRQAEVSSSASLQAYKQQAQQASQAADTVQIKSSSIAKNLDTVKAIEQMHSRLNELVKGVRQTNEQLNKAAEQVAQMQGNLMTIVKNYPPYPIESMERRDLLMSYMSLRKDIENLMIPPPPQPVYEKVRSMWEAMFSQNGQLQASAVPALEAGSSDKQVQVATADLGKTHELLSGLSDQVTQALLQP
ncbi:MAG: hypothetical protein WBI04_07595 [Trichlorobacter sp.]|jgi:hypothetical protein